MTGPTALAELLGELEEVVQEAGARTDLWLAPGLSTNEIEATLASVGLRANEELLTWFGWHNGIARSEAGEIRARILPGIVPGSLHELVTRYRTLVLDFVVPTARGVETDPRLFTYGLGFGWLPLEADTHTRYAVSCHGERDAVPLVRRSEDEYLDHAWDDKLQAVSLCTPVAWWLEGINSGAHRWNHEKQRWDDPDQSKLPQSQLAAGFY